MDLSVGRALEASRPQLVFSPHPILLGRDQELVYAAFLPNETVLEYLRRTGLLARLGHGSFTLTVDGRRLPRTLWARCRPKPGTLINLYATVRGGGGGKKNPIATIAMIALVVYAPQLAGSLAGSGAAASTVALYQAGIMVVGGMVINAMFPPPRPDLARAQNLGGGDSPTYAIAGGSNRMRRYEPMPKILGVHRVFPDFGAQPYNEFEGNEQVGYYVFDFGYNDAELTDFKIGDTPIDEFEGVEMEISGADGKLALFPGNVDAVAGVELTEAIGFVSRTSSPDARSLAVELTGALFYLGEDGTEPRAATVEIEYRLVGAGAWTALQFAPDTVPATSIVEGVARIAAAQHERGTRKEITVQPAVWDTITVLSASANSPAGAGQIRAIYYEHDATSVRLRWVPNDQLGSPGGPFVQVRGGGLFVLYDQTGKRNLLIQVDPSISRNTQGLTGNPVFDWVTVGAAEIPGQFMLLNASREPLRRTFKWNVAEGQYEVRVKKSSPDEVNQRAQSQLFWSQLRTYQPDDADYTGRLRVGLKVRASALASGVLQQLSCIARGKCRVWGEEEDFDLVASGDAQGGSADSLTLAASSPAADGAYVDYYLRAAAGPGSVQERRISAYEWRVNLLKWSEGFENAAWIKSNAAVTADAVIVQGIVFDKIETTVAANPNIQQSVGTAFDADEPYTQIQTLLAGTVSESLLQIFRNGGGAVTHTAAEIISGPGSLAGVGTSGITVTGLSTTVPTIVAIQGSPAAGGNLTSYIKPKNVGPVIGDSIYGTRVQLVRGAIAEAVAGGYVKTEAIAGQFPVATVSPAWRVNMIRNSEMVGAVTGSPGTVPTGWGTSGSGPGFGVVRTITAIGVEDGLPFIEVNLAGTSTGGGTSYGHYFDIDVAAAVGQTWSGAFYVKVIGTPVGANFNSAAGMQERTSANVFLASSAPPAQPTTTPGLMQKVEITRTLNQPTVGEVWLGFTPTWSAGATVDITYRVYAPHLHQGAAIGEYIGTTGAAITLPDATTDYELLDPWPIRHTSNPAWWYLDALRGKVVNGRRVYGAALPDTRNDVDGLKAFATWCVQQGLTVNAVLDQQQSLFEVLSAIALMGRATPTMQTGKHGVLWDAPDLPVTAHFGMHNIHAGTFEIEYATGDLADVIEGWFINPELGWQRDFVRALVPGAQSQARVRRVELFGCTDKAQAQAAVNLYAAANVYRPRRYKWRSDWEQMPCPRGDVAMLGHDLLQMRTGRLIEGGDASTLKLPRLVPLYATGGHVTIVKPDGTFDTYAVDAGAGDTDTLALSSPLPFNPWADASHPPYDYRWHYGPAAVTGRKVKIETFKPVSEGLVDVTAVDEDPAYYAAKDNAAAPLPAPHIFGQVQLQAVSVTEDGVRAGTGYLARVMVSWDALGDYGFADVRAAIAGGPMEMMAAGVRGRSYSFNVADFTDVVVEVTAWSSFGRHGKSSRLAVEHFVDYAGQSPPSDARNFLLDGMTFRWTRAPEVDVVGARIRYHFGENRSIESAHELHEGLLATSPATFQVLPSGPVTFFITEVDAAGLESVTPAIVVKDLGDPELTNVVEEKDFRAESWPGTVTGGADVAGDLEADGTTDFYGVDSGPFYGADADPFYEDEVYEEMVYETEIFYFSIDWIGSSMTIEHTLEGLGIDLEYRQTNAEDFYGEDGEDFYGADAESFYGDDGEWRSWTGTLTYQGGDVQLRVTTAAGPVQGAVRELRVVIDVPDIVEELENVEIPPGGLRLPLTKDFDYIKTVQLTLQDDGGAAAVSARYLDKDPDLGPLVECIDETKASVAGILDATITGR